MLLARLTKPLIAGVWAVVLVIGLVAAWFGYRSARNHLLEDLRDDTARCAAAFDRAILQSLAGTRDDQKSAAYTTLKPRLARLQVAAPRVRLVYVLRHTPETGRVVLLASSAPPGSTSELLPGDEITPASQSLALRQIIQNSLPIAEGPVSDDNGTWATGYALVSETTAAGTSLTVKEIVGLEVDAAHWRRTMWSAAGTRALIAWVALGLPFAVLIVLRRQLAHREAIRNLSAAMEQSHSALMIVDLESRIEYVNHGLCQQTGYSRRELLGRNWRDFRVAETANETLADLVTTVRSGRAWEGEWFNCRKNGEVYPVRGVVTPVKERDGSLACFIAVFDDATEAKRRETEMREARDLAEAGDRAKGQFLATMSHEIRTPLNGIVGFTNLLLGTELSAEQRDFVETIHASTEALISLTGDILDYARIESGKLKLEPLPCDPREIVEDALDMFAARAAEKKLELLHTIAPDVPAAVLVDGARLRQVLTNLVNNAVKFTPAGEIEVSVAVATETPETGKSDARLPSSDSCLLRFSVRDTGIGIPAELHPQLFRPFNQLDASSTRKYGGTGLGLAICRNLLQLLGGEIHFTSEAGRGSTFTVTMRVPVAAPAPALPELGSVRLALVGKPSALRRELARLVTHWGASVIEVDEPAALKGATWEAALVDLDEETARALTAPGAPPTGLPVRRATALIPLTTPTEMRTALRTHFHLLLNKPVHQSGLLAWLTGVRPAAPLAAPPPTHFGLRVLVVEDNQVNQRLMQRVLTNLGCKWTIAETGQRALDELARPDADYDVVLLDLHMPELDGLAALEKIRSGAVGPRAQSIWIAALTADVRPEQRTRTLAAGANDFLPKPLQLAELEAAFRRYRTARPAKR